MIDDDKPKRVHVRGIPWAKKSPIPHVPWAKKPKRGPALKPGWTRKHGKPVRIESD